MHRVKLNMYRNFCLLLGMIGCALNAWAENVSPYSGSRIFWDTTSRTTVFSSGGYARIIQLQDGRLMAICESAGINIAFSSNNGGQWTAATKIVSNTNNTPNCVPDLIQLSDGTIIVAYNPRPSTPYTEDRKFGIRCKRSTDNGKTWSDEIFVNDAQYTFENGCWEPSMLELPSGEVQLYFADEGPYTTNADQQISMCRSYDGGQTWSTAQKVSYREGHRDGMPVPVLLKDESSIVVAIEDNGWSGINNFFPTTVRCPMSINWKSGYYITGTSANREKTLDMDFCPLAAGGAPYLRVLPWGETVLSYQSNYNHGDKNTMFVAVGNEKARNFKSLSNPFITSQTDQVLWNSVAVIDTGIVVAVGGVNGKIELIKGYPTRMLQAPYGKPNVDGVITRNEGYLRPVSNQIMLGTQYGVRTLADFSYDEDYLYFIARVTDTYQVADVTQCDGVRLLLDIANASNTLPQPGVFSFFLRLDNTLQAWEGNGTGWGRIYPENVSFVTKASTSYYVIEAAIPWTALGKEAPPVGERLAATIEVQDRRETTLVTERIHDCKLDQSWTWMEFRLLENPETNGIETVTEDHGLSVVAKQGNVEVWSNEEINTLTFYSVDGKAICSFQGPGKKMSGSVPYSGLAIVKARFANGKSSSRKIIL